MYMHHSATMGKGRICSWHITPSYCHHYAELPVALNIYHVHIYSVECVSEMKSTLIGILCAIYCAVCYQVNHFSFDDRDGICTSFPYHQI